MCTDPFIFDFNIFWTFQKSTECCPIKKNFGTIKDVARPCTGESMNDLDLFFKVTAQVALFIVSWICSVERYLALEEWDGYFHMCRDWAYEQFLLKFFLFLHRKDFKYQYEQKIPIYIICHMMTPLSKLSSKQIKLRYKKSIFLYHLILSCDLEK